jgi:hypothetical protein
MSKIQNTCAVVLIAGAAAFAENTDYITYTLQLGGSNEPIMGPFNTTGVVEPPAVYYMPSGEDVVTWSVRITAGGARGPTGQEIPIKGAANLVWDLYLLGPDGHLVGGGMFDTDGGFGITAPGAWEAGFYSTVMCYTGGGPFAQQPAAFARVFETWYDAGTSVDQIPAIPFGRLIDPVEYNGPNMAQYTYPSAYRYYRHPGAANPIDPKFVWAPSGTLMGMGAGYMDFDLLDGMLESGGVGLSADSGQGCFQNIGNRPIVEGQINLRGLPPGRYTLQLIPGTGNNVLWGDFDCIKGTSGAFAARVTTVNGSSIQFWYSPFVDVLSCVQVNISPPEAVAAGAQWSDYSGRWLDSGANVCSFAGQCAISYKPVPGWTKPADHIVTLTGTTMVINATYTPPHNGDMDGDGHVAENDVVAFRACFSGPMVAYTGDCIKADFDNDGDVDQIDFGRFGRCFAGPEDPPACQPE